MITAGLQMGRMELGDMRVALPNLEKSVDEARRAQDPSLLAGILVQQGQVYVATGRLEDGLRSFEEALLSIPNAMTEANLAMCQPHTCLAEVLLERADLAERATTLRKPSNSLTSHRHGAQSSMR